jgi:YD repeat-containing protein
MLPTGKWTQTVRDGRSLVVETRVGHGDTTVATTTYSYDVHGNLEEQTAPNGVRTRYEYDDFDRVIKVTRGY